ncbi:hypothetical protein FQA39_LY04574 [Lamprigera yunnana]|nr:hypothetical protein FQA39_LY04574 [Lamprigera yunnana]
MTTVSFLMEHRLLDELQQVEPFYRCGSVLEVKKKRDRGGEYRPVEVWSAIISRRSQMIGTVDSAFKIDEVRLASCRKYNRGRMLNGDEAAGTIV